MATQTGIPYSTSAEAAPGSLEDDLYTASSAPAGRRMESGTGTGTGMDADDLFSRIVRGAHEAVDRLAGSAAPHVQRLQEGMSTANDSLHTRSDDMRVMGDEWAESLRTTVREHPVAAVATALAVGVLVARLTA